MPMNFKVTFANGTSMKLMGLPDDITLDGLRAHLFEKTSIPPQDQHGKYHALPGTLRKCSRGRAYVRANIYAVKRILVLSAYGYCCLCQMQESTLTSLGVRTGSVLVLKEAPETGGAQPKTKSVFIRRVMPADNSCLFHSIGYALGKGREGNGPVMRQLIKDTILADPEKYSEVFLGRPVYEYCAWIMDDKSWGGEIELSILSTYYQVEMVVFDVTSMSRLCYGEDQGFTQRLFLLYDGIHYDLVVEAPSITASESQDVTLFAINDFSKVGSGDKLGKFQRAGTDELVVYGLQVERASEVAVEAHQKHEFTDVSRLASCAWCAEVPLLDRKKHFRIRKQQATSNLAK
ncbi:OTU domain [Phytophthora cactorum]|nr:OTU domain [Phytophthora cactorum]